MIRKLRLYTVDRISNFLLTHLHCSGSCASLLVAEGYIISEAVCVAVPLWVGAGLWRPEFHYVQSLQSFMVTWYSVIKCRSFQVDLELLCGPACIF